MTLVKQDVMMWYASMNTNEDIRRLSEPLRHLADHVDHEDHAFIRRVLSRVPSQRVNC